MFDIPLLSRYGCIHTIADADREIEFLKRRIDLIKSVREELIAKEQGKIFKVYVQLGNCHEVSGRDMFGGMVGGAPFYCEDRQLAFITESRRVAEDFKDKNQFKDKTFKRKYAPKYNNYMLEIVEEQTYKKTNPCSTNKKYTTFGKEFCQIMREGLE